MNTPRRPEPTIEQLLAAAAEHGIDPARLLHLDEADGAAGDLLVDYRDLTDVRLRTSLEAEHGLYIAESTKIIDRALRAGHVPRTFLMSRDWFVRLADRLGGDLASEAPILLGSQERVDALAGFHVHRGALASMRRPQPQDVADAVAGAGRVVVVEDVVDHTNLGAIFRSAAGLGVDAVLLSPSCADPLYRRSIRVSMGTVFQVPWTRLPAWPREGVDLLHEAGFDVLALALSDGASTLDAVDLGPGRKVAFVLGAEGHGLKPATLRAADEHVVIPMAGGVDSLNVAAASAVVFWQRRAMLFPRG